MTTLPATPAVRPAPTPATPAGVAAVDNPLVHRVVLSVPARASSPVLPTTRRLAADWLTEKFGQAPLASGIHTLSDTARIAVASTFHRDGTEDALRLHLREDTPDALWRTTVTARSADSGYALVAVDLERFPQRPGLRPAARPRLIAQFVRELDPSDGPCPLTCEPWTVSAQQVPELLDWLTDPGRRLPLVLAAPLEDPHPVWERRLAEIAAATTGAASLLRLRDAEAVDAFRRTVYDHHSVRPGCVRTYLPLVDPAWSADGARHRVLTAARLLDAGDRSYKAVAAGVRELACARPWPARLRDIAFPAEESAAQAHMVQARARASELTARQDTELSDLRGQVDELGALLALADQHFHEQHGELELARRRNAALAEQAALAQDCADAELADHALTLETVEHLQDQVLALQAALAAQGRLAEAYDDARPAPAAPPQSFEELLDRANAFPHLVLPRDPSPALKLDSHAKRGVWAAKAWHALRSLEDYAAAAAGGFRGSFYLFCQNPPPGARPYPPKQVAMTESQRSIVHWADERRFPVPTSVHPTGRVEMFAHLKLDNGGIAPRIHFLDASAAHHTVFVGYIGPHLTNTRT